MANRQTYVIGALGVLVGMVVGATSAQRADIVSYSGHNPNSETVRNMNSLHQSSGIFRVRSVRQNLDIRDGTPFRLTAPRRTNTTENVARRREIRLSQNGGTHFAAPAWGTVRGAPAQRRQRVPGCSQYSSQRYTHCLEAIINGEVYEPNYFPTNY
ncbi:MAG: hypothetical protein QF793_01125 [Candidatus Peribacteraceae bacterium]|jgi:hypothetical protein|nr:hypothetical protein [bacterium]MDP6561505.1 hypothetical protein [Candidatus Peribacteraceae bacterium]|tara:strand:+ start:19378 stop:19845 length:468 start_codon:yes stop_codon:yes gene_type:complete